MITRDNYEAFFLLYIDNELPIAEKQAVERFVAEHPDLREEWEALLQCRMIPDRHLSFPDQDALRRPEIAELAGQPGGADGLVQAEGPDFLSYIDGEMDGLERAAVEQFVQQHPRFLPELEAWRNTISYPDTAIVCPDKESLYKRERKPVLLPWVRIGVAAAILGIIALLLLPRAHRQAGAAPAAEVAPATAISQKPIAAPLPQADTTPFQPVATTIAARPSKLNKKNIPTVTPVTTSALHDERDQKEAAMTTTIATTAVTSDPATRIPEPATIIQPATSTPLTATAMQAGIPREESSFATQALQNENNDPDNNSVVTSEPAAPGKGRLRGIFRKVTRAFGKTADRDKDGQKQVLVGAFQFALN